MKRITYIFFTSLLLLVLQLRVTSAVDGPPNLKIAISNLRNSHGTLNLALFTSADGFPNKFENAVRQLAQQIDGSGKIQVELVLPEGKYAVAVFHDENRDSKLDKNFIGMPTEGIGFSNNPASKFGPPKFDDCVVSTGNEWVNIKVHY